MIIHRCVTPWVGYMNWFSRQFVRVSVDLVHHVVVHSLTDFFAYNRRRTSC